MTLKICANVVQIYQEDKALSLKIETLLALSEDHDTDISLQQMKKNNGVGVDLTEARVKNPLIESQQ